MKKILCLLLVVVLTVYAFPWASAAEEPISLERIAEEYIIVSTSENEVVYSNLSDFYRKAVVCIPDISDIEIAEFVFEYTAIDCEDLNEREKLEVLEFVEIRKTVQIYSISEGAASEMVHNSTRELKSVISPLALYESDDDYIMIETNCYVEEKLANGDIPYILEAEATWLMEPAMRLTDTFAIVYGGAFDDSYKVTATLKKTERCGYCGKTPTINEEEIYGPDENDNNNIQYIEKSNYIELDFGQDNAVGMKFPISRIGCNHFPSSTSTAPVNYATFVTLSVSLKFRVLISSTTQARAAYAHKYFGADVNIGASVAEKSVKPIFDIGLLSSAEQYSAAPVTLRVT